jgi:hypothetical protein
LFQNFTDYITGDKAKRDLLLTKDGEGGGSKKKKKGKKNA